MKIAATGITSGVGRRLAEIAIERGDQIRGLARNPQREDALALAELGVDIVRGDLMNRAALAELCDGADIVIHMAAHVGDWGAEEQFQRINVDGTRNVLQAAAKSSARRFVQLSSTAVYGRPESGRVTERWPTRKHGPPYDQTKTAAERLAFAEGKELGLEVSAVRPPLIYGPYDRNFIPRSLRMLEKGLMILVDGGHAPLNVVWVDHVVDVLLLAAEKDAAVGQAFNVMDTVDKLPPSLRQVGETIARAAGFPPPTREVPARVAKAIAGVAEAAFRLVRSETPPPATPWVVRLMTLNVIYDASKAVKKARLGAADGSTRRHRSVRQAPRQSDVINQLGRPRSLGTAPAG